MLSKEFLNERGGDREPETDAEAAARQANGEKNLQGLKDFGNKVSQGVKNWWNGAPQTGAAANPMAQDPAQRAQAAATAPPGAPAADPMSQDPAQRAQAAATPVAAPAPAAAPAATGVEVGAPNPRTTISATELPAGGMRTAAPTAMKGGYGSGSTNPSLAPNDQGNVSTDNDAIKATAAADADRQPVKSTETNPELKSAADQELAQIKANAGVPAASPMSQDPAQRAQAAAAAQPAAPEHNPEAELDSTILKTRQDQEAAARKAAESPPAAPAAAPEPAAAAPAAAPAAASMAETAELNRILKLSGMEFIAEDAATGQQFVGTGSSNDWSMSETKADLNVARQMIKQKYGNNPPPANGIELKHYVKQSKTIADPAKPGNYLTTVTYTPREYKLSPGISAKPSMDPKQDFDYFYNGQQVKPGDPFYDKIKQIHTSLGADDEPTNESAELGRLSKLISEDSSKSITVQRGDTLGKIAADNSTTVDALVKLNNIENPNLIHPGDVIKIPGGPGDPGPGDPGEMKKRQGQDQTMIKITDKSKSTATGNAKTAMDFFTEKGWTPEQAAGIVANLQAESYDRLDPAALGDKGRGYGIAQWHGPRQQQFEKIIGVPLKGSSLEDQLKFVQWELTSPKSADRGAGDRLKQATTASEAAAVVDEFYERSSGIHRQRRIAKANALLPAVA